MRLTARPVARRRPQRPALLQERAGRRAPARTAGRDQAAGGGSVRLPVSATGHRGTEADASSRGDPPVLENRRWVNRPPYGYGPWRPVRHRRRDPARCGGPIPPGFRSSRRPRTPPEPSSTVGPGGVVDLCSPSFRGSDQNVSSLLALGHETAARIPIRHRRASRRRPRPRRGLAPAQVGVDARHHRGALARGDRQPDLWLETPPGCSLKSA